MSSGSAASLIAVKPTRSQNRLVTSLRSSCGAAGALSRARHNAGRRPTPQAVRRRTTDRR